MNQEQKDKLDSIVKLHRIHKYMSAHVKQLEDMIQEPRFPPVSDEPNNHAGRSIFVHWPVFDKTLEFILKSYKAEIQKTLDQLEEVL